MSDLALQLIEKEKKEKTGKLDLGKCGLTEFPDALFELSWLEELSLSNRFLSPDKHEWIESPNKGSNNRIRGSLPDKFEVFTSLKKLSIPSDYNALFRINDASVLGQLTGLQTLDLSKNHIRHIHFLEKLTGLQTLYLSSNRISDIRFLEKLTGLQSLDLSHNQISDIRFLEQLTGLQSLYLSDNQISDIRFMEKLTGLQTLDLSSNEISDIRFMGNLTGLQSLDLRSNQISDIRFLEKLTSLQSLVLRSNKISDIRFLEKLTGLQSLYLSDNQISDIRILEKLTSLQSLVLRSNQISDYSYLEKLTDLKTLDLCNNKIIDIRFLEKLTGLKTLDLSYNQINDIHFLEKLTGLQSLYLSDNQISDYSSLEQLATLQILNLRYNQISDYSFLEKLAGLQSLDLSYNEISDTRFLTKLTGLQRLELRGNQISDIRFLEKLTDLQTLDLSDNQISDISPLIPLVEKGISISDEEYIGDIQLFKNPITTPPIEIVKQGREAVLNYFREIDTQGVDRLYEAKLLIVGEGGSGKTSLVRRLFLPDMDLPNEDETTRGIDIHHHEFPVSDERTFRLNTWDFGGQQIYHATHQFFLTKRSLYVLVDDTRSDHRSIHDEGFKFWLEVIETLSESSPLLIFQNEKGGRSKQIDIAGIKGRFPNVQDVHQGNLQEPDAAESLLQAVEYFAQQLPHIGEDVPARWVDIRRDLESLARTKSHIPLDEYFEIYGRHLELDHSKALLLSQYLHDLGVFLHFQHPPELRRTVFLQNQWVTEAVFRILDDERVKAGRGRFTLADCDRLWMDQGFAAKDVELRALMERFELSYRLPDTDVETWLVPQHLSPSKPSELTDWANTGDLMMTYLYDFLPRGLVSRLMVRMQRFVQQPDLCWTTGALFEHGETQVMVATGKKGNEIALRSRGPEHKTLLSVIASDLDALNDSFQGLRGKVGKWVPCTCPTCSGLKDPAMFAQQELIDRKTRGKKTIECPKPPNYEDVSVLELLDGMNLEQWLDQADDRLAPDRDKLTPTQTEDNRNDMTVRIFLASSAELRKDRDAFDLYFRQQNDRLRKEGLYLEIVRWENFLDAMSSSGLQDEYNKAIRECDIFVSLFMTKTGKYTEEEFDVAHQVFSETDKPKIYTYFKESTISISEINVDDLLTLRDFKKKLGDLGHFHTEYKSIEDLQKQFRDQLDKLRDGDKL